MEITMTDQQVNAVIKSIHVILENGILQSSDCNSLQQASQFLAGRAYQFAIVSDIWGLTLAECRSGIWRDTAGQVIEIG
jgi:hypothetical protein